MKAIQYNPIVCIVPYIGGVYALIAVVYKRTNILKLQIEIEHFDTNNLIAHGRDNRRLA